MYVIRDRRGKPKTDQACRDAWEGAMQRAGLGDKPYRIKDIRAKAMTDAKRSGYDLEALQVAGTHTDRSTTEGLSGTALPGPEHKSWRLALLFTRRNVSQ
jgi:hypothetical protein